MADKPTVARPPGPPPTDFPADWASGYGEDRHGWWQAFTYRDVRQVFRWIPPGRFLMGSPKDEIGHGDFGFDETRHEVLLTRGYWLAETACTQALWEAVMGQNPSRFKGEANPVEQVSWEQMGEFIGKLNGLCPGLELRLPSEAEWEYACRAGTAGPFSFGEDIDPTQVNYDGNFPYRGGKKGEYRGRTVAVGSLPANPWGLYEMHGNVWEHCADWLGDYPPGPVQDPEGLEAGDLRVMRGGSWLSHAQSCRSARRYAPPPVLPPRLPWFPAGPRSIRRAERE